MRKEPRRQSSQLHAKLRSISPPNTVSLSRGSPGNPQTAAADNASFSPPRDLGGGEKKKKCLCIPEVGAQRAGSESEKLKRSGESEGAGECFSDGRRGAAEAVFEQGEECSARGRISGGGEASTGNESAGKTAWD